MEELIKRMRALLDPSYGEQVSDAVRHRGMHDLLLAMEERVQTVKNVTRTLHENSPLKANINSLLEKI